MYTGLLMFKVVCTVFMPHLSNCILWNPLCYLFPHLHHSFWTFFFCFCLFV
uniref:Uncharacterized protein n=1 Tax=Rhizophora mucronata TaxID=61149 RepID=A0A2P2JFH8_RHIMU